MGRRLKFTAQEKLTIIKKCRSKSISAVARTHTIDAKTITGWI